METGVSDVSNPFSVEGDSLILGLDLYDADSYDVPDPGLLKEKNGEVAWPRSPRSPRDRPHSGTGSVCRDTTLRGESPNLARHSGGPLAAYSLQSLGPKTTHRQCFHC